MKMTERPSFFSSRRLPNSSSTSCGTRTAVGSSRITMLRAAVEHLEDLHPLPGAHAELLDQPVGLDAEAVGVRDALDLGAGVAADAVQLLGAEDDVLEDGEVVGEHEVLEHHADAGLDRVGRRVQGDLLAVDLDRARVRRLHAVEDLHQRRLAGAVLPDDRVDGAAPDVDVDVVVGDHTGEPLADPAQADGDRRRRLGRLPRRSVQRSTRSGPPLETSGGRAFRRTLPNGGARPDMTSGPADPALGGAADPEAVALIRSADQGVVGTVISPSMICCLKSSSWSTMSSI